MGVTISYRGSLAEIDRIEDFEDRVLDLALELGGQARIWRSSDDSTGRMVRGVILNLFPGQETTSLLISPEGWLINLFEIEAAEKGPLDEQPWCCVKTQFGPVEGHVALVELLVALKEGFFPNLEVHDDGDYWATRDLARLTAKMKSLQAAIEGLADGLERYGLSKEAAEDREILLARIERIAQIVHRTLSRPSEHPPVRLDDDDAAFGDAADRESQWDASYKENRRRQERMHRTIEERMARGEDVDEAFDAAMLEHTSLGLPDELPSEPSDEWQQEVDSEDDEFCEAEEEEPWKESLASSLAEDSEDDDLDEPDRHPLMQRAMDLMFRLHRLLDKGTASADREDQGASAPRTPPSPLSNPTADQQNLLLHGAGEIMGGLAQALSSRFRSGEDLSQFSSDEDEPLPFADSGWDPFIGLSVVQLKRALRGAAFARGALINLRAAGSLDQSAFDELHDTIESLETDMYGELSRLRQRRTGE
jgi:hypothetical protein